MQYSIICQKHKGQGKGVRQRYEESEKREESSVNGICKGRQHEISDEAKEAVWDKQFRSGADANRLRAAEGI